MTTSRGAALVFGFIIVLAAGAVAADVFPALDEARQSAMVAADAAALDTLLADECVYTHSTGLVQNKDALIAMLVSGEVSYESFDTNERRVDRYGDTVVVTGRQTIELMVRGAPVTSMSRYTAVWARTPKGWRCVAYQSTPIPQNDEGKQ